MPPPSSFQNSRRRLFWDLKCASVARWHMGQSVSSRSRTYSHLLFKEECSVKRSLLLIHFLFIILDFKSPICSIVIVG